MPVWYMDPSLPLITEVAEYEGQAAVRISATQLDPPKYTRSHAARIVTEWVEFLASGPTAIRHLAFTSRTPKRLFAALAGQSQLERLAVKWGDYDDLSPLTVMQGLIELRLGGASSVRDLTPLTALQAVAKLEIESLRYAHDLAPLAKMRSVVDLELGGDWMSPRIAHVDTLDFLRSMSQLRRLVLHTMIVDDLDYTPVLALANLESVRVARARGMRPPMKS